MTESLKQIGTGLLLSLLSIAIILGAFSLAMAEGGAIPAVASANTSIPIVPTISPTLGGVFTNTPPINPAQTITPTISLTPPPPLTTCPPPAGWVALITQTNDTLASLAQTYRTSAQSLRDANCLLSDELVAGSILYVPPQPTATRIPCGAPAGWQNYIVQPGDSLYRISLLFRTSIAQLQQANCLLTSNIKAGQILKVPSVPTTVPTTIPTDLPSLTPEPPSATPELPSVTPELPSLTPETPSATPETPSPITETPSATPETPSVTPEIPTFTPSPTTTDTPPPEPILPSTQTPEATPTP